MDKFQMIKTGLESISSLEFVELVSRTEALRENTDDEEVK